MRVFEVWVSSSSPRLPCAKFCFSFMTSIAELADREKSHTQSLTHSLTLSLFDALGTKVLAFHNKQN